MLYFHAETGTHVRAQSAATRTLRRHAPRVVMFGVTNVCNLRCAFCSRDTSRTSDWTVDSAASVLEGLAEAGTLEVAFGGGEPFAFRGFEELLLRLHGSTALALNVTTNGTLLRDGMLERLRGVLGQVRLSIYDGQPWRSAAEQLRRAGHVWGANVLVDDAAIAGLEGLLAELAGLGARDASLLSYVGPDPRRHLSRDGERRLGDVVRASALPCRVSVCFGDRLPLPRLFDGSDDSGDCGAGLDFLTVTPDRRVQSCSFQTASFAVETAEDVLSVWRERRDALAAASSRAGCARPFRRSRPSSASDGLRVWRAFSGNNSGECVLVAKFDRPADADAVLAELLPGFVSGQRYEAPWKELFEREQVDGPGLANGAAPEEMVAVGRSLIARTDMAPGDEFPELRALAWKRGGEVLAGGVHVHEETTALLALRAAGAREMESLQERAGRLGARAVVHGEHLIAALSAYHRPPGEGSRDAPLGWMKETALALALGEPVAMELYLDAVEATHLTHAIQKLGAPPASTPRVAVSFWGAESSERAERFAAEIDGDATRARTLVLVDHVARRKRLALRAHRQGGSVRPLDGDTVRVTATFWREPPARTKGTKAPALAPLDARVLGQQLGDRVRRQLGPARPGSLELESCELAGWGGRVTVALRTSSPSIVLTAIDDQARAADLQVWIGISDVDELERAVRRLIADVTAISRERR